MAPKPPAKPLLIYQLPTMVCCECETVLAGEVLPSSPMGRSFTVLVRGGHLPSCSSYGKTYKLALSIHHAEFVT